MGGAFLVDSCDLKSRRRREIRDRKERKYGLESKLYLCECIELILWIK